MHDLLISQSYLLCAPCFQNAPRLPIDKKLKDILKVTPGACLQYVVIEGNQSFICF